MVDIKLKNSRISSKTPSICGRYERKGDFAEGYNIDGVHNTKTEFTQVFHYKKKTFRTNNYEY